MAAGARSLHVHPRDGDGAESLEPDVVEAAVAAIRRAARGVELTVSTGLWIADGDPEARAALLSSWTVLPDVCSVNVAEPGWRELIRLLADRGVAVEAGLWSHEGAVVFAASGLEDRCLRALVEPQEREPGAAMVTAAAIDGVLGEVGVPLPRLHHGYDAPPGTCSTRPSRRGATSASASRTRSRCPAAPARPPTPRWSRARATATRRVARHPARVGLLALMALAAFNLVVAAPVFAIWVGSRVQGGSGGVSMTALLVVILVLAFLVGCSCGRSTGSAGRTTASPASSASGTRRHGCGR